MKAVDITFANAKLAYAMLERELTQELAQLRQDSTRIMLSKDAELKALIPNFFSRLQGFHLRFYGKELTSFKTLGEKTQNLYHLLKNLAGDDSDSWTAANISYLHSFEGENFQDLLSIERNCAHVQLRHDDLVQSFVGSKQVQEQLRGGFKKFLLSGLQDVESIHPGLKTLAENVYNESLASLCSKKGKIFFSSMAMLQAGCDFCLKNQLLVLIGITNQLMLIITENLYIQSEKKSAFVEATGGNVPLLFNMLYFVSIVKIYWKQYYHYFLECFKASFHEAISDKQAQIGAAFLSDAIARRDRSEVQIAAGSGRDTSADVERDLDKVVLAGVREAERKSRLSWRERLVEDVVRGKNTVKTCFTEKLSCRRRQHTSFAVQHKKDDDSTQTPGIISSEYFNQASGKNGQRQQQGARGKVRSRV